MNYVNAATIARKYDLATTGAAIKLMRRWGVDPIYLGPGRGLGYRWPLAEVEAAASRRTMKEETPKPKKKAKAAPDIFDLPESQAFALLTQKGPAQ